MEKLIKKVKEISQKNITDRRDMAEFSETREIVTPPARDMASHCQSYSAKQRPVPIETRNQTATKGIGILDPAMPDEKMPTECAEVAFALSGRDSSKPGDDQRSATDNLGTGTVGIGEERQLRSGDDLCPYCNSKDFVKRGKRKKKLEVVQLYLCRNCNRTFTANLLKGKHYPSKLIIDAISIYNLGFGLEETCRLINERYGRPAPDIDNGVEPQGQGTDSTEGNVGTGTVNLTSATLNDWYKEYSPLCRYSRLRQFGMKLYKPEDVVGSITLAHRQLYRYRFHRAKMALTLQEYKHRHLEPLKEYLEAVFTETPHQYFQEGSRISEVKTKFNKAQMIVRAKKNYANRLAEFVLQSVKDNKQRHEELQKFMLANDSVTVATEVPVYIRREDIEHFENVLGFNVLDGMEIEVKRPRADVVGELHPGLPRLLTGHIDLVQVRNGQIHILDYKPHASKEKPIEQLTWYALALSRLTGLRLYEFKCAWFDEKDYFEFYPLHVVKKIQNRKKPKKVYLKSLGTTVEVPEENASKIKII